MYYRLVRINAAQGQDAQSWNLELPATLGRSSEATVYIDDDSISRSHCQLLLGPDEGLLVRDHGSTNGTYINGERVRQMHSVVPGDLLQLGAVTLRVDYASDTDPGNPVPKRNHLPVTATQPMRTLPSESFTMHEVPETPKRWWEFWKSE